jgi:glycosyltransferase involved in cell wall biosynthesis
MDIQVLDKPLVSLLLITYKQEKFIAEAVESALAQTYSPLEVVLSDDSSPDGTFDVIQRLVKRYRGPHRVIPNRNTTNLGAAANLNRCWELSKGAFVVVQAGDDVSYPERVERLTARWQDRANPVDLVGSNYEVIDEAGVSSGLANKALMFVPDRRIPVDRWRCGAAGSTASYSRTLFTKYGPMDTRVIAEDWVFSFRAWVENGIAFLPEPLVKHRKHAAGISVQARNLSSNPDRKRRMDLRQRFASGAVGIAEEWLKAWKLGKWRDDTGTQRQLERLVQLRAAQYEAFTSPRLRLPSVAARILRYGGVRCAAGSLLRNAFRVY